MQKKKNLIGFFFFKIIIKKTSEIYRCEFWSDPPPCMNRARAIALYSNKFLIRDYNFVFFFKTHVNTSSLNMVLTKRKSYLYIYFWPSSFFYSKRLISNKYFKSNLNLNSRTINMVQYLEDYVKYIEKNFHSYLIDWTK